MSKSKSITVALVLLMGSTALAEAKYTAYGPVNVTCGSFLKQIENEMSRDLFEWWLGGFLSGINFARGRETTTDREAHLAWMKNYCEQNPLELFVDGAAELGRELDQHRAK